MIVVRGGRTLAQRLVGGAAHDQQVGDEQIVGAAEAEAAVGGGEGRARVASLQVQLGQAEVRVLKDAAPIAGRDARRGGAVDKRGERLACRGAVARLQQLVGQRVLPGGL